MVVSKGICLTLNDSKYLHEAVHNIKNPVDKRLLGDVLQIKQAIAVDKIITEFRHIPGTEMLANPLTKGGTNADDLMKVNRSGVISIPGGLEVQCSSRLHASTWQKLMQAQNEDFTPIFLQEET